MVDIIISVMLFTFLIGFFTFMVFFIFFTSWRRSRVGRYMAYFLGIIMFVFGYIAIARFLPDHSYKDYLNIMILIAMNLGIWKMVFLIIEVQRGRISDEDLG